MLRPMLVGIPANVGEVVVQVEDFPGDDVLVFVRPQPFMLHRPFLMARSLARREAREPSHSRATSLIFD